MLTFQKNMFNLSLARLMRASMMSAILVVVNSAGATESYPEVVQEELDVPCVPACTLCHRDSSGGVGTVTSPFGESALDLGLAANDEAVLREVLSKLEANDTDSDVDGTSDVEELRAGNNPNQAGDGLMCVTYGCRAAARSSSGPDAGDVLFFSGLLLALGLGTRVGRRRRIRRKGEEGR